MNQTSNTIVLHELQGALSDQFDDFFPDGIDGEVEKETFQSETFIAAGYDCMPEIYGKGDMFLHIVKHSDGRITFVITGKVSSENPLEVGHAVIGGLDLRKDMTVVYQYDGRGTITERRLGGGPIKTYSGEHGKPEVLLSYVRPTLGKRIANK